MLQIEKSVWHDPANTDNRISSHIRTSRTLLHGSYEKLEGRTNNRKTNTMRVKYPNSHLPGKLIIAITSCCKAATDICKENGANICKVIRNDQPLYVYEWC